MTYMSEERLRTADIEGESALAALGEHRSLGRPTLEDYAHRSAMVVTARTQADLRGPFRDHIRT